MTNIKVRLSEDRIGNVTAVAVRDDIQRAILEHLQVWVGTVTPSHSQVFLQESHEETLRDVFALSTAQIKDLHQGGNVTIIMDSWHYLSLVGYDAHNAIEVTPRKAIVRSY